MAPMATAHFLWPKEISYGHRRFPMPIGDVLWPEEMSYKAQFLRHAGREIWGAKAPG